MAHTVILNDLMAHVHRMWHFDGQNYKGFDELDGRGKQIFPIRHSVLHLAKSVGKLAAEAEKADHGDPYSEQDLRIITAKLLASVLNLAAHLKMEPEKLADLVENIVRSR